MKKSFLFLLLLFSATYSFSAENKAEKIDSTLMSYYRRCSANKAAPEVLLIADTLFRLAQEKGDLQMQAVALTYKADYYYFNNNLDSLKAWIPRVQTFARNNDQLSYYYFVWARLILYHTKHAHYATAQYELKHYLSQAEKDDYKPAIADSYVQLAHIYLTKALHGSASEYYRRAIDYIEQHDLSKFALSNYYSALATSLTELDKYDEALEVIERGKKAIVLPEQVWDLEFPRALILAKTGRQQQAEELFAEVVAHKHMPSSLRLERQASLEIIGNQADKALSTLTLQEQAVKEEGYSERYYLALFKNRAAMYALKGRYREAYDNLLHYNDLYQSKTIDESQNSLEEFATLLDVTRLDHEKTLLKQQAQAELLRRNRLIILCLVAILGLAAAFIIVQVRTNRRLAHAKRAAEEANRMKGVFIRTITHEINTPLNSIVGFSELASSSSGDDPDRQSYIDIICENSNHLQKLIDDVLYISDLESSETPPAIAPTDIDACCRSAIDTFRQSGRSSGSDVRFEPSDSSPVLTSRLLITKVLNELLCNAARFAPQGTTTLTYALSNDSRTLTFTVTDTGPGIPTSDAERIFERFVKLDPFGQGLGLGLSVCRLIADTLGGEIRLDTTYRSGARFVFIIPVS